MNRNQRKISQLQALLERVQQRAANPRTARISAATAAVAVAASASSNLALALDEPELTPLAAETSTLAHAADLSLQPAEELTPSEEILVIGISSVPPPVGEPALEVVVDEDLASEAALIEEALTASDDEDEAPISSRRPRQMHDLEAAMEPMTLDPISDRPTARITLPPESGPLTIIGELTPAPIPKLEIPSEPDQLEPEIEISTESTNPPSLDAFGGLIPVDDPVEPLDLDLAPIDAEPAKISVEKAQPEAPADRGDDVPVIAPASEPVIAISETEDDAVFDESAEEILVLDEVTVVDELPELDDDIVADARVEAQPPPLPLAEPAAVAEVQVVPEPTPAPLESPPAAAAVPVAVEIAAEIVRRPEAPAADVAAIVGEASRFAPKTFGELLDASLDL